MALEIAIQQQTGRNNFSREAERGVMNCVSLMFTILHKCLPFIISTFLSFKSKLVVRIKDGSPGKVDG